MSNVATFNLADYTNSRFDCMTLGGMCAFIDGVAKTCPERAKEAVDRYVSWLQHCAVKNGRQETLLDSTNKARTNIEWCIGYFNSQRERNLLFELFGSAFGRKERKK